MSASAPDVARVLSEVDGASRGTFDRWSGPPLPLVRPADEREASAFVAAARAARLVVLPLGLGTKVDWCALPARADVALSTERIAGAIAYEPAEGVVTARAGTRLADLAALLGADGQRLAPDVPHPARATLGGAIASAQGGADRLRRGTWRDAVLGIDVLGPSGVVTKSGGRLVKNVTGYDLFRLHEGAHGALGVIVAASLRLCPDPTDRAWVERDFDEPGPAIAALLELWRAHVPATRFVLRERDDGGWIAAAHLEGRPRALAVALARTRALLGCDRELAGAAAQESAAAWRDLEGAGAVDAAPHWPLVECFGPPASAAELVERARSAARTAGFGARLLVDPALARVAVLAAAPPDEAAVRRFAAALGHDAADARWRGAPAALRGELAGPPPIGHALMARLVAAEDPTGVLVRGRVHPSL